MLQFIKKRPFLAFLAPGFILYTLLVVYPIFSAARLSLYHWNGIGEKLFVGFGNYVELFTTPDLMRQMTNALKNSLMLFILTTLIQIPVQVIIAYAVYTKARGKQYFQVAIFSPQFISTPVIIFILKLLLDGNIGIVNQVLEMIGLGAYTRSWMGISDIGIYIVWGAITWAGLGVGMMYLIGAMKMIDYDCMESAYLDGAGYWKRLFHIVLPQIKTTLLNLVLLAYIFGMTIFDYSYLIGGDAAGGINGSVDVMSLFFYRIAFGDTNPLGGNISTNSMGMGTTVAVVLFLMIFIIALGQILLMYRREED